MDASVATRSRTALRATASLIQLSRTLVAAVVTLLAMLAIVVCVRRLAGTPMTPLPASALWACAALLALVSIAYRRLYSSDSFAAGQITFLALWSIPSVTVVLWGLALSFRASPSAGLVGLWGILLLEEGWSWRQHFARLPAAPQAPTTHHASPRTLLPSPPSATDKPPDTITDSPDDATQQFIRRRTADGNETIEGWLRVDFQPGQRYANAHLAICPALERVPQCYVEQSDGPSAEVKIGQVLPYGVRFEIKLDKPPEQSSVVVVEFSIQEPRTAGEVDHREVAKH